MQLKSVLVTSCLLIGSAQAYEFDNLANQPVGMFGELKYTYSNGYGNYDELYSNGYFISLGTTPFAWLDLDVNGRLTTVSEESTVIKSKEWLGAVTAMEMGAKVYYGIQPDLGVFARGSLGQMFVSSIDDFSYGAIEPGFYWNPYGDSNETVVELSYTYQGTFDEDVEYDISTWTLGGEYEIDKGHLLTASFAHSIGDKEANTFGFGYRVQF